MGVSVDAVQVEYGFSQPRKSGDSFQQFLLRYRFHLLFRRFRNSVLFPDIQRNGFPPLPAGLVQCTVDGNPADPAIQRASSAISVG